ncbi:MAG: AAA family ATPase [Verrucomicrobiales bacterium]
MFGSAELLAELREVVAGPRAQAALLVGPPGVGKTALVMELARAGGIDRPIFQTGGARLVAGQTGFGMWQKRVRELVEEAREQKAILYLGSLFELMETGTYEGNAEGIASFLRPYFVRGELIAILEATPEQVPAIEKRDPKLLDGLRRIPVAEPDPAEARQIIEAFARHRGERFTQAGIDRTIALHRRYASYSAFPGRPLRFMDRLLKDAAQADARLGEPAVNAAFSRETGLPMLLIDDATRLDPAEVRAWFGGRIAGQDAAADQMADTIAMIKAGLSRPEKPLASFFFAGPTGVGKTEMAKAIAEFFYGAKDRMIRFDMSEFGTPGSAARMAGGGAGGEGQLTAKVRAQPFGVILLDEIEKADAEVFDLLLQILGEGRLTDSAGRVADFTNAIIIMTSNLGARDFQRGAVGFRDPRESGAEAADHFSAAVKAQVRPELFNRIDQILPFLPLTRDAVAAIARREIALANARDGLCRRGIELRLSPGALRAVLDAGYDPAYGARPLKRALESLVLAPLAAELAKSPRDYCVAVAEMGEGSGAAAIAQFLPAPTAASRRAWQKSRTGSRRRRRRGAGWARSPAARWRALQSEQSRLQMRRTPPSARRASAGAAATHATRRARNASPISAGASATSTPASPPPPNARSG